MLDEFLSEKDFSDLQAAVLYANEELEGKTRKARAYATLLRQRVARQEFREAYRDFKLHKSELADYLDAQTFAELETAVVSAYEEANGSETKTN